MKEKMTIVIDCLPTVNPPLQTFMGSKVETIIRGDASEQIEILREENTDLEEEKADLKEEIAQLKAELFELNNILGRD